MIAELLIFAMLHLTHIKVGAMMIKEKQAGLTFSVYLKKIFKFKFHMIYEYRYLITRS